MDKKQACYCGLYCGNCAVKTNVEPASKVLYDEMNKLGFEEIVSYFPDGEKFWSFLKNMTTNGICISCKAGSGNPLCKVRQCAKEKNVEMCALCNNYPCEHFTEFFKAYPSLQHDNLILQKKGWAEWENYKMNATQKAKTLITIRNKQNNKGYKSYISFNYESVDYNK